jgi:hypothetical protein
MQNTKFTMRIDDFSILQDSHVHHKKWARFFLCKHDSKIKAKSTYLGGSYMETSLDVSGYYACRKAGNTVGAN